MTQHFLQCATDTNRFEEVDEYLFERRDKAILIEGEDTEVPRYSGAYVIKHDDSKVEIVAPRLTLKQIAIIASFVGSEPHDQLTRGGAGFIHAPGAVYLKLQKNSYVLYSEGEVWKRQPKKKAA